MSSFQSSSNTGRPVDEILTIFRGHIGRLLKQQQEAHQSISDWSSGLVHQIREHASQQNNLVNQLYDDRLRYFESMREQFLASSIYERTNDSKEMCRLLEKCKTLEVELVKLEFRSSDKDFIEVIPVDMPEWMDQEQFNPSKMRDDKFEDQLMERRDTAFVHDRDLNLSSYSKSTASTADRTIQPSTTQSMYIYDIPRTTNDNNNLKTDFHGDDNLNDKCPMCFMIFPGNMSTIARSMHVAEHCQDDNDEGK